MRRVPSLLVLGLMSLLGGPVAADQVVLRDGRTLDTKKPPVLKKVAEEVASPSKRTPAAGLAKKKPR